MNRQLVCCTMLALAFTPCAPAQSGKTPSRGRTGVARPRAEAPDLTTARIFLSGKVVLDDGTPLTDPAAIQTICKGQKRTETYTDSHGGFTFEFGSQMPAFRGAELSETETSWADTVPRRNNQRDWRDCELQAVLPGFSSQSIQLNSRISNFESSDIGRVVLHRLGQVEGFTISATSALAPGAAKKAFDNGRDQEKKSKWDQAQRSLEKAVQIYPNYAVAWFELGRVQVQKNDVAGARHSFAQALAADPKYVSPYQGLAELALREKHWQELVDTTSQLLALNAVSFPDAWFRNAAGNYHLRNFEAAEKSARQGLKLDERHQIPKMEYLLGVILMQKHEYQEASEHMQQFLHLATNTSDVDEAQKKLAEIARFSAAVSAPAASEKK